MRIVSYSVVCNDSQWQATQRKAGLEPRARESELDSVCENVLLLLNKPKLFDARR